MNQSELIERLMSDSAYPHDTDAIESIQTHISWVILTGPFAYKIKKAVKLPYLDFSTLELRQRACREEVRLNRRLAPDLYLDVVPIGIGSSGPELGVEPAVEFAVKMVQFPADAAASRLIESNRLEVEHLTRLAESLAEFHRSLPGLDLNHSDDHALANLSDLEASFSERETATVAAWLRLQLDGLRETFSRRQTAGFVKECHGDLHLGNLTLVDGRLLPFDCLEFSRALREIDVFDEVAFLFMDLTAHNRADLAFAFLNRYVDVTGDHAGLGLLRFYSVHRALVRAKVTAAYRAIESAEKKQSGGSQSRYLRTAAALTASQTPALVIMWGLTASGKSTIATELARRLPAIHLRSDLERKRLHGLGPLEESDSGIDEDIYSTRASNETYDYLARAAETGLTAGFDVIVDASFLDAERRHRFRRLAAACRAGFVILACTATPGTLRERLAQRAGDSSDPSEGDAAVLDHQLTTFSDIGGYERGSTLIIDTEARVDIDDIVRDVLERRCPGR